MTLSNYLEQKLLDHTFGGSAFTQPSGVYTKLHIGDPGEDGTANAAANTTRQATTFAAAANPAGTKAASADVVWTNVSTTETYSYISLWDASSAGNCLGSGALTAPVSVTAGDTFTLTAANLVITLS